MAAIKYISDVLNKPGVNGKRQTRRYTPVGNSIGEGAQLEHERQGRPRIADFPCPKCGQDALICRTLLQMRLLRPSWCFGDGYRLHVVEKLQLRAGAIGQHVGIHDP